MTIAKIENFFAEDKALSKSEKGIFFCDNIIKLPDLILTNVVIFVSTYAYFDRIWGRS